MESCWQPHNAKAQQPCVEGVRVTVTVFLAAQIVREGPEVFEIEPSSGAAA